jgi:ABC-type uncharacterized transport system
MLSAIQGVCAVVIFLTVNYLAGLHYARKDLSGDAAYTVSVATRNYLKSPAIQDRKEPVEILLAYRTTADYYERIRALAEEYENLSNHKIHLTRVDPVRSPDAAAEKAELYGPVFKNNFNNRSIFTRDLVVVDARPSRSSGESAMSPHVRFVESVDMIEYEVVEKVSSNRKADGSPVAHASERVPKAFHGEDALTMALMAAIEGKPRNVYVLGDKSSVADGSAAWKNFQGGLLTRNCLPVRVNIGSINRIPDDASAVAILGTAYDLEPRDLEVLKEYWQRPKSAIFITTGGNETPSRLRGFLREYGVTPRRDRVMVKRGNQVSTTVQTTFTKGMDFMKDFWDKTGLYEGATCSLEVREGADDLTSRQIFPITLMETSAEYWGETNFSQGNPSYDPREDHGGQQKIAAAVIHGAANSETLAKDVSKMVVLGNTDFLEPSNFSDINRDFLTTSFDWLVGKAEAVGSGPRSFGTYKLPLLDVQVSFVNRVNLIFLPIAALIIAGFVWSSRRA